MKRLWNSFLIAFSMYSKIPVPQCAWTEENMAYSMCFFPWIGLPVGALLYLSARYLPALGFGVNFTAAVLVLIPYLVTGGIHLDGLLDTADAMSSWRERERRLQILKDPHTGAFATLAAAAYFLFSFAVYSQATLRAVRVIAPCFMLSRTLSALAVVTFPKAKVSGTVSAMARGARERRVRLVLLLYLILLAVLLCAIDRTPGVCCLAAALLSYAAYYRGAMKYFGGTTGDLAGCFLSLCELFMACGAVAAVTIMEAVG